MALIIEDGSKVSGANSYATEAELTAYAAARGVTITGTAEQLMIKAMDYLEGKRFVGSKAASDQALQWPRYGVLIDGFYLSSDSMPENLKEAQMEIALALDADNDPLAVQGRETRREKIGDLEVEYASTARASIYLTGAENKLRKLVKTGVTVIRS